MQSHMWGRSAQTVQVRVCTNHVEADPEDPNITCGGLEVRVERASAVNYWTGEHTGPEPDTELVIQRIRSRAKDPEPFDEIRFDVETSPVGPALRLYAEEGFDLLRVLTRALKLARDQGLCSERKRVRPDTEDDTDVAADLLAANRALPPPLDEEEELEELARRNRLALAKQKPARREAPRRSRTRKRQGTAPAPSEAEGTA